MRTRKAMAFAPYEGDKPMISCCYMPQDAKRALPYLYALRSRSYRVWYDGLAAPGRARSTLVSGALERASLIVLSLSEAAAASPLSRFEFSFAVAQNKPIVCVFLDDAPLPAGLQLQLQNAPSVQAMAGGSRMTPDAFLQAFAALQGVTQNLIGDGAEGYDPDWRAPVRIRAALILSTGTLLLLGALTLLVGVRYDWFRAGAAEEAVTDAPLLFSAPLTEPAVEAVLVQALGLAAGDAIPEARLLEVTALSILGDRGVGDGTPYYLNGSSYLADGRDASAGAPHYYLGSNYIDGRKVEAGTLKSTADFARLTALTALELTDQRGVALDGLSGLPALAALNLSNVESDDYTPLASLASLRTADVSGNGRAAVRAVTGLPLTALAAAKPSRFICLRRAKIWKQRIFAPTRAANRSCS